MGIFRIRPLSQSLRLPDSLSKVAARFALIGNLGLTKLPDSAAIDWQPTYGNEVRLFPAWIKPDFILPPRPDFPGNRFFSQKGHPPIPGTAIAAIYGMVQPPPTRSDHDPRNKALMTWGQWSTYDYSDSTTVADELWGLLQLITTSSDGALVGPALGRFLTIVQNIDAIDKLSPIISAPQDVLAHYLPEGMARHPDLFQHAILPLLRTRRITADNALQFAAILRPYLMTHPDPYALIAVDFPLPADELHIAAQTLIAALQNTTSNSSLEIRLHLALSIIVQSSLHLSPEDLSHIVEDYVDVLSTTSDLWFRRHLISLIDAVIVGRLYRLLPDATLLRMRVIARHAKEMGWIEIAIKNFLYAAAYWQSQALQDPTVPNWFALAEHMDPDTFYRAALRRLTVIRREATLRLTHESNKKVLEWIEASVVPELEQMIYWFGESVHSGQKLSSLNMAMADINLAALKLRNDVRDGVQTPFVADMSSWKVIQEQLIAIVGSDLKVDIYHIDDVYLADSVKGRSLFYILKNIAQFIHLIGYRKFLGVGVHSTMIATSLDSQVPVTLVDAILNRTPPHNPPYHDEMTPTMYDHWKIIWKICDRLGIHITIERGFVDVVVKFKLPDGFLKSSQ